MMCIGRGRNTQPSCGGHGLLRSLFGSEARSHSRHACCLSCQAPTPCTPAGPPMGSHPPLQLMAWSSSAELRRTQGFGEPNIWNSSKKLHRLEAITSRKKLQGLAEFFSVFLEPPNSPYQGLHRCPAADECSPEMRGGTSSPPA